MNIVNLTPHEIVVQLPDGSRVSYPSQGVARVSSIPGELLCHADGIPLFTATKFGEVVGLPDPAEGTIYIVSAIVASAVRRYDVYSPDGMIMNQFGHPTGVVTRLVRSC